MHQQANKEEVNPSVQTLQREIRWFTKVLETRMQLYFRQGSEVKSIYDIPPPKLEEDETLYSQMLMHYGFGVHERLILLLAMMPHIKPEVLDLFFTRNSLFDRPYSEFGGITSQTHRGFLPTGETVMFLLTGGDLKQRLQLMYLFDSTYPLQSHHILEWGKAKAGDPLWSRPLTISEEYLTYFLGKEDYQPTYSANFPARLLKTPLQWEDLVVNPETANGLQGILNWVDQEYELQMNRRIKPGYRALFYGPSGTGKTLAAALLAKKTDKEIYRINLAAVVSKYIGETEKNLNSLFERAERNEWILFFDEADALFGKRTDVKDSHDRYANQEVSYFFDCLHNFQGLCIVAIHNNEPLDTELVKRFQTVVHFPLPDEKERLLLWQKAFGDDITLSPDVDLNKIARDHPLTGEDINEVLRHCLLAAAEREDDVISLADVSKAVMKIVKW